MRPLIIFTVGHSTRAIDEFVHLLKAHDHYGQPGYWTVPGNW